MHNFFLKKIISNILVERVEKTSMVEMILNIFIIYQNVAKIDNNKLIQDR